jgi:glutaredoxin 3
MMTAVVWSKDGCGYCVSAKSLLESKGIAYEERNIQGGNWTREQLLEAVPTAKSLPQIFLNEEYIGGFTELKAKLQ